MTEHQKGKFVMEYLHKLDTNWATIGESISNENLGKSYELIKSNPKITKQEFLTKMNIEEYVD